MKRGKYIIWEDGDFIIFAAKHDHSRMNVRAGMGMKVKSAGHVQIISGQLDIAVGSVTLDIKPTREAQQEDELTLGYLVEL